MEVFESNFSKIAENKEITLMSRTMINARMK
jgi:hypothetical protein